MIVLGLNAHHADAAACLIRDGELLAAVAEERLNRVKHCAGFPTLAVAEVLRIAGVTLADVDRVAIARDSRANLRSRAAWMLRNIGKVARVARKRLRDRAGLSGLDEQLAAACGVSVDAIPPIERVEHHLAHAASTFLFSGFDRAAILTLDGFGDFASSLTAVGEGTDIKPLSRVIWPHSLGILYTSVCQFIGFDRYGDEGKVMGLAPYGKPTFEDEFAKLLQLTDDGFALGLEYFNHHTSGVETGRDEHGSPHFDALYTDRMRDLFGDPRGRDDPLTDHHRNIAASLQKRLEDAVVHLASLAATKSDTNALCLAGGVALNGVANAKILERTDIERLHIHPAAGDDGTAVGAAAWVASHAGDRIQSTTPYLGNRYDDAEIERAVANVDDGLATVTRLDDDTICERTAALIADGLVVGWFQGAMEWGPRALGNRSIVAHPGHPEMKDRLNSRIKHREPFRPFAPSILAERLSDYFESNHPSPSMLLVYRTRPDKRDDLCAVNHVDDTGRVQTVTRDANPRYYRLIECFEKITGTPVVLNTSFNENEPIVCTPAQALDCFTRTRMDAVAIGNWLVQRKG